LILIAYSTKNVFKLAIHLGNPGFNGYAAIFGAACDAWDGLIDLTKTITLFGMKGQARIKTAKNCNCLRDAPDNLMSTAT